MYSALFLFAALPGSARSNPTPEDALLKCSIYLQACPRFSDYKQDWSFSLNENDRCLLAANKLLAQPFCWREVNPCSFHLQGEWIGRRMGTRVRVCVSTSACVYRGVLDGNKHTEDRVR